MLFQDRELRELIIRTANDIELRNVYGRLCRMLSPMEALELDLDVFIGIGNRRRLRFLRPRTQVFVLNKGSRTTRRLKSDVGRNIAHPLIREHRPMGQRS